ncbi:MAG: phosphotransferase enzyme family protein, partial [candidate division KSB1 bacterium]|nr:phosphotransferase enzyme family protein [candidate division KSB1 bacterium]
MSLENKLVVKIYSFGFHLSGIPEDTSGPKGGFVFDCRFLPNPGREERFAHLTGRDKEVIDYLEQHEVVQIFLKNVFEIIDLAVRNYQERGFTDLMVSFGCTGGQHRSVYCAERLYRHLRSKGVAATV